MSSIDLNADLAAANGIWQLGGGDDLRLGGGDDLLDIVTSAGIACGGQDTDPSTMRRLCTAAAGRGVSIGARIDYPRRAEPAQPRVAYDSAAVRDALICQIAALDGFCRIAGTRVRYVKAYGALGHTTAVDETQADAVVTALLDYDYTLPILCRPGSVLAVIAAQSGLTVVGEGFVDRGYRPDGTLLPRSFSETPRYDLTERARRMALQQTVIAVDGSVIACPVASIRVPQGSSYLVRQLHAALTTAPLTLSPFAPSPFAPSPGRLRP